jgi:hypothetical protein
MHSPLHGIILMISLAMGFFRIYYLSRWWCGSQKKLHKTRVNALLIGFLMGDAVRSIALGIFFLASPSRVI